MSKVATTIVECPIGKVSSEYTGLTQGKQYTVEDVGKSQDGYYTGWIKSDRTGMDLFILFGDGASFCAHLSHFIDYGNQSWKVIQISDDCK